MYLFNEVKMPANPVPLDPDLNDVESYRPKKHKRQKGKLLNGPPHEKKLQYWSQQNSRSCSVRKKES